MGVIQIRLLGIKQIIIVNRYRLLTHTYDAAVSAVQRSLVNYAVLFDLTTIRRSTLFYFQRMNDIVSLDENINLFCVRITKNGKIRAYLEKQGTPIGPLDTMIAGHAKSLDYVLVTNNTKEFSRVQDLKLENWAE